MSKENIFIKGIFHQAVNGQFGFIETSYYDEHIFVFGENKANALDKDEVEAKIVIYKGRKEAIITDVIKRSDRIIIGKFQHVKKGDFGFVSAFNPAIKKDIFIPRKYCKKIKDGKIVAVKITKWEGKNPEGIIQEILGDKENPKTMINGYILEAGFKLDFPENVKKEMENLNTNLEKEIKRRKDKRNLFTFTIDGEDAKDLDDAISLEEKENGGYKLYVHIADVAHYVKNKSFTQRQAFTRGTSVYLPHTVLPMLPKKLSNDLCSLNPNTDKLTLTCEIHLDEDGKIEKHTIYESVINSDFRLTYEEVDKIINKEIGIGEKLSFTGKNTEKLKETLKLADNLRQKVGKIKKEQGILGFDFPETKIILDENLKVIDFQKYKIYESNNMIEEFMVLANECVSRKFHKYPFLYRVHEKPQTEDIAKLEKILKIFGVNFNFENHGTKEYGRLIEYVKDHKGKYVLEKLILRTLKKAEYSNHNSGHFGLGLSYYSHFTSPIRRYPDYQIHRIIKLKLQNKATEKIMATYKKNMENIGVKCTEQEIKAQKLEWKVRDYFMTQYYKDKIGEEVEGIISGMIQSGIFVELENTAEGFVELVSKQEKLDTKKSPEWVQDSEILEFVNSKNKNKLRVGDKIKVRVKEIDEKLLRINFELI